jgi:mono/diheme cytochrome c family protein
MYSNGVRVNAVDRFNRDGYLAQSPWVAADRPAANLARGEAMFRGQCLACHTRDAYRPMKRLLAGRDREAIGSLLKILHDYRPDSPYRAYMPPLVGTPAEIADLRDYLATLIVQPTNRVAAPTVTAQAAR